MSVAKLTIKQGHEVLLTNVLLTSLEVSPERWLEIEQQLNTVGNLRFHIDPIDLLDPKHVQPSIVGAIEAEALRVANTPPRAGGEVRYDPNNQSRQDYLKRIVRRMNSLPEPLWKSCSPVLQAWTNKAVEAVNEKRTVPEFPGSIPAEIVQPVEGAGNARQVVKDQSQETPKSLEWQQPGNSGGKYWALVDGGRYIIDKKAKMGLPWRVTFEPKPGAEPEEIGNRRSLTNAKELAEQDFAARQRRGSQAVQQIPDEVLPESLLNKMGLETVQGSFTDPPVSASVAAKGVKMPPMPVSLPDKPEEPQEQGGEAVPLDEALADSDVAVRNEASWERAAEHPPTAKQVKAMFNATDRSEEKRNLTADTMRDNPPPSPLQPSTDQRRPSSPEEAQGDEYEEQ